MKEAAISTYNSITQYVTEITKALQYGPEDDSKLYNLHACLAVRHTMTTSASWCHSLDSY